MGTNPPESSANKPNPRPPRVLVVDDEHLVRSLLERFLERKGFQIISAEDGQTALRLFQETPVDLVLSDLRMPGLDGLQLLIAIKELSPRTPVVIISGHGDAQTVVEALKAGAENFLAKPLSMETLNRVVDQALAISCLMPTGIPSIAEIRQVTHLQCPSQPEIICELVQVIAMSAVNVGYALYDLDNNLKLALVEAITNAMEHGNKWNAELRISLEVELTRERLTVSIQDEGPGFEVSKLPDPTSEDHLLAERGRGVFLMRAIMDEVSFNATGNMVTMAKASSHAGNQSPGSA